MSQPYGNVARAIQSLIEAEAHRATIFVSPTHTVKVTRRSKRAEKNQEFIVTIGRPNWHERQRVKTFLKAQEPFPVKRVQLQFLPKK